MAEAAEAAHFLESKKELAKMGIQFFDIKKCAESAETAAGRKSNANTSEKMTIRILLVNGEG